jgi:hypothetical protein
MLMSKEQTIHSMCMTVRHDYGLRKQETDGPLSSGMTDSESKMLYNQMEQLYNHHIQPVINYYQGLKNETK